MYKIILIIFMLSFSFSAIEFSGDARVRPRYDAIKYGLTNGYYDNSSDFYYQYRARINMKADIGEGWFFSTKLGTKGVAGMTKMSPGDLLLGPPVIPNPDRPSVSFLELYYGYTKENKGFWAGVFPLVYSPSLDLHFYSDKLVDTPWIIYNNSSVTGFAGYCTIKGKKLNWFLSIDADFKNHIELQTGIEQNFKDIYTIGLNSTFEVLSLSVTPNLLISISDKYLPTTYGFDIGLPDFSTISSRISYHISSNDIYDADHFRFLLTRPFKDGSMKFFYDIANNDDDSMSYVWLSYTYICYEGELGTITVSPTYRFQDGGYNQGDFDKDYSRTKFEITTEIKFK